MRIGQFSAFRALIFAVTATRVRPQSLLHRGPLTPLYIGDIVVFDRWVTSNPLIPMPLGV